MKHVVDIKGIICVRILEGLSKGREGEINAILAKPDRDGFFVKIQDEELARETDLVFSRIVGSKERRG